MIGLFDADAAIHGGANFGTRTIINGRVGVKMFDADAAVNLCAGIRGRPASKDRIGVKMFSGCPQIGWAWRRSEKDPLSRSDTTSSPAAFSLCETVRWMARGR